MICVLSSAAIDRRPRTWLPLLARATLRR